MIRNLAYIGFVSPAAGEWRTFGPEVLGAQLASDGGDGAIRLRVDEVAWRIAVHPGPADDVAYLGWLVDDETQFDDVCGRVEADGISVHRDDAEVQVERPVTRLAWFVDRIGFRHEIGLGPAMGGPFEPAAPVSGFVTGEQGLGHMVLFVPDVDSAERFFVDVLGFRLSDTIHGRRGMLRFFHCPGHAARHHTVALAMVPGMVGLHHLMLEVPSLDDVGGALDRVNDRKIPMAMSLGRHPNDLMTSFYVRTPSGFEIEYGTGGRLIDDDTWPDDIVYERQSLWGHKLPDSGPLVPAILHPAQAQGASA